MQFNFVVKSYNNWNVNTCFKTSINLVGAKLINGYDAFTVNKNNSLYVHVHFS